MQLALTRSQKTSGTMSKSVVFVLDARIDLTEEVKRNVSTYRLGKIVIYNSQAARKHLDRGIDAIGSGSVGGLVKAGASIALAKFS